MVEIFGKPRISWKDKIKMKLCGDLLNISKLQAEIEELKLENKELNSKIKYSKDNTFSKYWKKTFFEDMKKDIYDYEYHSGLIDENTKLYSQLQELAKHYESSKNEINELNIEIGVLKYDIEFLESKNEDLSKERNGLSDLKTSFVEKDNHRINRNSKEYNKFKNSVLRRDKICQCCGTSDNLEVHHGLAFKTYNSLGTDTRNGIVLCYDCHKKYHSLYGTNGKTNNLVTLAQFLRDYGISMQSRLSQHNFKKDIKKTITNEIEHLEEEFAGLCPVSVLEINLESRYGFNKKEIDKGIENLAKKGLIYYPQVGYIRVVS